MEARDIRPNNQVSHMAGQPLDEGDILQRLPSDLYNYVNNLSLNFGHNTEEEDEDMR